MVTVLQKKRNLRYLNRDFQSFKEDLVEHLRIYFPDTVQDFNESSVGMMLVEMAAFIGDNLSFYLDKRVNESFLETASDPRNIFKHAKQLGFKAFGKTSATGYTDAFLKVPAITSAEGTIIPDMRYAGTIKKGAKLKSKQGLTYETLLDIDFSSGIDITNNQHVVVAERDPLTKQPTSFVLRKVNIDIKAGETKSTTISVDSYRAFRKITLPDDDVLEILSMVDSEGNKWYEVDFLAQDTIFDGVANTGVDSSEVPYVLKLRSVPYRFTSDYDLSTGKTSCMFGTGDAETFDGELIPDLGDLALPLYGKDTFTDFSLDPQNFLKTSTLGLAPVNTSLSISYRVGGGFNTNAGTKEIDTVAESVFTVGDSTLDSATIRDVGNSFSVLNSSPVQGGRDALSAEEIRQLIPSVYASQSRLVTAQDFIARSLSMPSKFGSIFRAYAKPSAANKNSVELITLSRDSSGFVTVAPDQLKENLSTYLSKFRMITDAIDILDGKVANIACKFEVLTNPDYNKTEILANCIEDLKSYFDITKWQISQPINLTDLYVLIAAVPGVLSVVTVDIINRVGIFDSRTYSNDAYNIAANKRNGIIYCSENTIFELKHPNKDISGVAR